MSMITEKMPHEVTDSIDDVEVLSFAMEASDRMYV